MIALGVLGWLACTPREGSEARDCHDNIDNDADGIVDCDENACSRFGCSGFGYSYGYYGYGGIVLVTTIDWACDPTFGWDYTFSTNGTVSRGDLDIVLDGDPSLDEVHPTSGVGPTLTANLPFAEDAESQIDGVDTAFTCAHEPDMVWRLSIYDTTGSRADCAVWSGENTDPSVVYGSDLGGCIAF